MRSDVPEDRPPLAGRRVAVIGAGYVGLPTALALDRFGHSVMICDRDDERLSHLRRGLSPILETGLEELLGEALHRGQFRTTPRAAEAVVGAEFVFLCVDTPPAKDGSADLSFITAVAEEIAPHLERGAVVVNKSTVPLGTAELVEGLIGRGDVDVVSNPEFLREGSAVANSLRPDRIVVGAKDFTVAQRVAALFEQTGSPVVLTDRRSSELIKYAANAFLATKLSFVNSLASMCEAVGADARDLARGIGYDRRIGPDFLQPGPGWGGACLPKDATALVAMAAAAGVEVDVVRAALSSNDSQRDRVVEKIRVAAGGDLRDHTVAVLGLTFKSNTDDRRNSPATAITRKLIERGARVRAHDPTVKAAGEAPPDLQQVTVCEDPYEALAGAEVVVILTEWPLFRELDYRAVRDLVARPVVVDTRNLLDGDLLRSLGFTYFGAGH